jgi:hypothetical protein
MRSSIKSTIVDAGNDIFEFTLAPADLRQWKDETRRAGLSQVKTLIDNKWLECQQQEGQEYNLHENCFRHPALIKVDISHVAFPSCALVLTLLGHSSCPLRSICNDDRSPCLNGTCIV